MAKQLNVNLAFSADTSKAKVQLQDLQNQLNKLSLSSKADLGITKDIEKASKAAAELSIHLKNATNQQTGSLDFSKLNQSIKQSGMSLQAYGKTLQSLGPQGQQAFLSLTQAVANSEVPIRRTNAMLKEMGTTLANTARWQLSSGMIHGFMGAVQSAYGYAQDLNESLNNIRIVTGQNIDQMAKFAEQANKAARALSATTTEYTNASLIYYQQGLNDQQVKERTDITIKMANVARQSAEVVSDQMTAVWNNFYDGSKSLEHYADVMTALGAATASSTDEIAEGLNKFAAVADTVGLSYEYAASALATVTATTRQSADVVGTAFKTLFARVQDLELGKTLDDGTTLGKYSAALEAVGVQIKDASGGLKDMDAILDDLGNKWKTLSKDTQVALAQTVAGTRQYTQLIALMDNWDFMEKNLATSNASTGALQAQADIYAESWEAAADRVTAAAENIYKALINDEFFIDILNSVEKIIGFVDHLIDSLGGLKGVLFAIGAITTKVFSDQMAQGLTNVAYNIKMMTEKGRQAEKDARKKVIDDAINAIPQNKDFTTLTEEAQQESMRSQLTLQQEMMENAEKMSAIELERNKTLLDRNRILQEQSVLAAKEKDKADEEVDQSKFKLHTRIAYENKDDLKSQKIELEALNKEISKIRASVKSTSDINTLFDQFKNGAKKGAKEVEALKQSIVSLKTDDKDIQKLINQFKEIDLTADNAEVEVQQLAAQIKALTQQSALNIKTDIIPTATEGEGKKVAKEVDDLVLAIERQIAAENKRKVAVEQGRKAQQTASEAIMASKGKQQQWSDVLVTSANLAFSVASAISMLGSAFDTIRDPDVSGWDKFLTILTTLGMVVPTLVSLFTTFKKLLSQETLAKIVNIAATLGQVAAEKKLAKAKGEKSTETTKENTKNTWKDTKEKLTDAWNKSAVEKKYGGKATKVKGGNYAVKGHQGIVSGKAAGKEALSGLGGAALSVAAIAASVAVAAAIVKGAIDHYNRFEIAAKKAQETANSMRATYETIQSAESEFRSNIDNYSSQIDGLEKLTKGTKEYKDAVREANNAAVKLLNTHKNLKYEINADGLIEIDEGSLLAAERESLEREARASAAAMSAQQDAANARLEADKVNFQRTHMETGEASWDNDDTTAVAGGVGAGAALGVGAAVAFANAWNPVGQAMIIAGALAAVIGTGIATFNNDAEEREAKTLDSLEAFSTANGGRDLTKEEITQIANEQDPSGKLAESLLKNVDATNDMIAEMRENTEAINRNNELIANQILQTNDYVMGSEYSDEIIERSGLVYGQAYEEALADVESSGWGKTGISKADGANAQAKQVWNEYLKYAGLEGKNLQLVDTTGTDDNRIFVYLDEQGQRQEKTLVEMQKMKAAWIAQTETNANANQLVSYFAEWSKKQDGASQAMTSFLTAGNFENATQGEIDQLKTELYDQYDGDYEKYLTAKLGDLSVAAEKLGFKNADKLIESFELGLTNIGTIWKDMDLSNLSEEVEKNISYDAAGKLKDLIAMMNAGQLGEQAGIEFTNGLNSMFENMSAEDQQKAMDQIVNIDWSQWNAGEQVATIIKNLGYELNMSSEAFKAWVTQMNIANGAVFDHAQALKDIAKMKDIIDNASYGDIISADDYNMLVKYNQELAKFFRLLGDGTYELVGDPLDAIQKIGEGIDSAYADAVTGAAANYSEGLFRQEVDDNVKQTGYTRSQLRGNTWGVVDTKTTYTKRDANLLDYLWNAPLLLLDNLLLDGSYTIDDYITPTANEEEVKGVVDQDLYNAQIDFIAQHIKGYDGNIDDWRNNQNEENAARVANIIGEYLSDHPTLQRDELTDLSTELEDVMNKQFSAEIDYAKTAKDLDQLEKMYQEGQIGRDTYSTAQLDFGMKEKWENMDPQEVEDYSKALMEAANSSDLLMDNLGEEAAEDVALYVMKMNKGIEKLSNNFEDWGSILNQSDKSSQEYAEAMKNVKDAMSDVLGVSEEFLSDNFIEQQMDDIALAAQGDADAINRLAIAAAEDILINIGFADENIKAEVLGLHESLTNQLQDIEVGATLNTAQFLQDAQDLINKSGMTVAEAQAYFNSLGYEPEFVIEEKEVPLMGTRTITENVVVGTTMYKQNGVDVPYQYIESSDTRTEPVETSKKQKISVPLLSGDGTPVLKSVTRKSSGSLSNFSSSNPGGKTKVSQKSSTKKKSDEIERYHTVNKEMDAIQRKMDRAAGSKDAAFGKNKLSYIQKEIDALNDLILKHKEYQDEIAKNLKGDKDKLAGFGFVDANADGILDNWEEVMEEQLRIYNEAAKAYDNKTLGEAAFNEATEKYEEFKSLVEQYEETQELWEEALTRGEELERERISKELEKITTEVDFEIEIKQRDLDRLERVVDRLSRDTNNMIEIIDTLGQQVSVYGEQSQWYLDGIQRIRQTAANEGRELTPDEQRKIWEYQDALEEINTSLEDIVETVENSLLEEFERWNSEIDENIDRFNTYSSSIEHYINIIKLSGRQTSDSMLLTQLTAQKTSIAMEKLNASYDKYQANLEAQKDVKAKLDMALSTGSEEDKDYWQKQYDEITKAVEQSHDEVLASWEDALQAASDQFDFTIEQTIEKLKNSISQFGLDGLSDRYEKAKTINEQYLSELEKEYELNKLIRQVESSIDNTDNLNAKRELISLLDKINQKTAEGVKLSKYDLDYMQAEYELELAKLALEEARNAKTSVRLQRDDAGNYSYVYTADQENIAQAEQNYEDKLYAIQELSKNHIDEMSDLIIQNEQELMEALAAVDKTKFETEEAYQAELNRITEYYYERDTYLRTELNKAVENMGMVYGDTILGQLENCSTWEKAQENLKVNTDTAVATMTQAWSSWKTNTEVAMQQVGTTSQNLSTTIQTDAQKIASATTSLAGTINTQTEQMKSYIESLIQKIWEWRDTYLSAIREMQSANTLGVSYDANADYSALMSGAEYGSDLYNIYKDYRDQKLNDPNYTGNIGEATTARINKYLELVSIGKLKPLKEETGKDYYTQLTKDEWIRLVGFKTGGYTGQWGPEGKLAYLHEKELVLNADDTKNILNAVDIVRTISKHIEQQAQSAMLGFASKATSHSGISESQTIQVEQDVTIRAEFPNATDQNEIKEAILGLVNYTAQYVAQR